MTNKNKILSAHMSDDGRLVIETDHFSVTVNMIDFNEILVAPKRVADTLLRIDYNVTRRTSYATDYKIKKFLKRLSKDAVRQAIDMGEQSNEQ